MFYLKSNTHPFRCNFREGVKVPVFGCFLLEKNIPLIRPPASVDVQVIFFCLKKKIVFIVIVYSFSPQVI